MSSPAIQVTNSASESFPRYGIQHYIQRRFSVFRVAGDAKGTDNGGDALVASMEGVYIALVSTAVVSGVLGFITPYAWVITATASAAIVVINTTDAWWNGITAGSDRTDGIVAGASQRYPNATFNYQAPDPVSHTAEIDSRRSANSIETMLNERLQVARTN